MLINYFKAASRFNSKNDWLDANFYFSFADKYDPNRIRFGALLVVNDDIIAGNSGFPTHSHRDMEIITIPMSGTLSHKDSSGGEGKISIGEVQTMTAGSGISHSEYNNEGESANSFQIWIFPYAKNLTPKYNQKRFEIIENNKLQLLVSPDARDGSLAINQDGFISQINMKTGETMEYKLFSDFKFNDVNMNMGIFVTCVSGKFSIKNNEDDKEFILDEKDWLEVSELDITNSALKIGALDDNSKLLFIQVPMI